MQKPGLIPAARHGRGHSGKVRQAGITLIELMMVLTIVAILGAIAVPSYTQYTRRAHRTDAKTALLRLATNQERFYLQNRRYGTNAELAALGFPNNPPRSDNGAYAIAITAADASGFTATATAVAGGAFDQRNDTDCLQFKIDETGRRSATPDPNPNRRCW